MVNVVMGTWVCARKGRGTWVVAASARGKRANERALPSSLCLPRRSARRSRPVCGGWRWGPPPLLSTSCLVLCATSCGRATASAVVAPSAPPRADIIADIISFGRTARRPRWCPSPLTFGTRSSSAAPRWTRAPRSPRASCRAAAPRPAAPPPRRRRGRPSRSRASSLARPTIVEL